MDIFEQATRKKLRFTSNKGQLTVEDLWELPLTSKVGFDLDTVAKGTNSLLKDAEQESFVAVTPNPGKADLILRMDLLKHVIGVKMAEAEAAKGREARRAERQRILAVLESKQDDALKGQNIEQLMGRLNDLDRAGT